ncbi:unnamed protein product [Rotaria sp. Silwood1]|nr:unnamed protein product [Rotaria sp. Silwood1]
MLALRLQFNIKSLADFAQQLFCSRDFILLKYNYAGDTSFLIENYPSISDALMQGTAIIDLFRVQQYSERIMCFSNSKKLEVWMIENGPLSVAVCRSNRYEFYTCPSTDRQFNLFTLKCILRSFHDKTIFINWTSDFLQLLGADMDLASMESIPYIPGENDDQEIPTSSNGHVDRNDDDNDNEELDDVVEPERIKLLAKNKNV